MANELEYISETGETVYAKPTPIVVSPWGTDSISLVEVGTSGYYSADVGSPNSGYVAGGSPALGDAPVASIALMVDLIVSVAAAC